MLLSDLDSGNMVGQLVTLAVYGAVGLAMLPIAYFTYRAWKPAAGRRGSTWYLELILLICGPISVLVVAFFPTDGSFSGPFPIIGRVAALAALAISIAALAAGLIAPRQGVGALLLAITFYYLTLILSGLGGVIPGIPEAYIATPIIVLAFLVHGGYSLDGLVTVGKFCLRLIVVLSLLAAITIPDIAFNHDGTDRTLFGIARLEGITAHPNGLALIAVLGLVIEIASRSRVIWRVLPLIALLLAQSITGYIAAAIGLLLLLTDSTKVLRRITYVVTVLVLAAMVAIPKSVSSALSALMPANFATLTGRTTIWQAALEGFRRSPIWGYGPSLLDEGYRAIYLPGFDAAAQAHNQVVQTLAGAGVVGMVSLACLATVLLVYAVRTRTRTRGLSLALVAVLAVVSVSETPLRPTGASMSTFVLLIVMGMIASAHSELNMGQTRGARVRNLMLR